MEVVLDPVAARVVIVRDRESEIAGVVSANDHEALIVWIPRANVPFERQIRGTVLSAILDHNLSDQPDDQNTPIWRYIDFSTLIDLLTSSSLWFTRLDRLEDTFEGMYPLPHGIDIERERRQYTSAGLPFEERDFGQYIRRVVFVNCWCSQPHESNALWRIYGGTDGGVALRTTCSRLATHLPADIFMGLVSYHDYEREYFDKDNGPGIAMRKREAFGYEHEMRLIRRADLDFLNTTSSLVSDEAFAIAEAQPTGLRVSLEIEKAIEAVVISPYAKPFVYDAVTQMVRRLGLNILVDRSSIGVEPVRDLVAIPIGSA